MSVWLPRSSTSLVVRAYSRNVTLGVRTLALASQHNSRLPAYPLYPLGHLQRLPGSPFGVERQLHSSPPNSDVPATNTEKPLTPAPKEEAPLATRVWKKVKHEAQHYWHGSKLLAAEVRISARLQWKILHGETLTRRERRQVRVDVSLGGLHVLKRMCPCS